MTKPRAHLIANKKSGRGAGASLPDLARQICAAHGTELVEYDTSENFEGQIEKAVAAAKKDGGTVIAAGGDGTIRSVAQKAHSQDVRFAVVSCGTFNFFARNHRIPEDPAEALALAITGSTRPVRLGEMNGEVFLINASLGLYAKAIRERERHTKRFGRLRIVAILSTIVSMLSKHRLLTVDLLTGKETRTLLTPMIFIGNNALQLRDLKMEVARCMKLDLLAVVLMRPLTKLEVLRVIFRGFFRTIEEEDRIDSFCVDHIVIHTRKPRQTVALDGEMFEMSSPLKIQALPQTLNMVLPPL